MIPLSVPSIKGNEWKYVKECLDTEWVSSAGKYVDLFEKNMTDFTGAKYAIAVVNGTSALHISLILAGVKQDDEVIVPTITFIAPVNAVKYANATPVFMDCDNYYNLDVDKTIEFILTETELKSVVDESGKETKFSFNKTTGKKVAAVIPVHIFGNAILLDKLVDVCAERNIAIIEDATESLGTRYTSGRYKGQHTGTIGLTGSISFNGNKIITTGGGGMILTDNEEVAKQAKYLTTQAKDDEVRYVHGAVGYNYRLTNIQAAIGVAQLEMMPEYLETKKRNFALYKDGISKIKGLTLVDAPAHANCNLWMYALKIDLQVYGKSREELMKHLSENGVQSRPLWYVNHLQKPYKDCQAYKIENAFKLLDSTLNIPCSINLKEEDVRTVIGLL